MTRPCPFPPGVRVWAWPRWRVEVGDRAANLSPAQARLLVLYLSEPGRTWATADLVEELYGDQEDGGPLNTQVTFFVTAKKLAARLARHGIALEVESRAGARRFRGLRAEGPVLRRAPPMPLRRGRPAPPRPPPPPPPRPAVPPRVPVPETARAAPWSFPERVEAAAERRPGPP